jgi:hypothetical protein
VVALQVYFEHGSDGIDLFQGAANFRYHDPDQTHWANDQLLDLMCLYLAGRAAEEVRVLLHWIRRAATPAGMCGLLLRYVVTAINTTASATCCP